MFKKISMILSVALLMTCGKEPDLSSAILDMDLGENTPETAIQVGDIDASTVTISWVGNDYVNAYRYRLEPQDYTDVVDTYTEWSEWSSDDVGVILEYLDEGNYKFFVEGRFNMDNTNTAVETFEIDAIEGPALRMYPLKQTVALGDSFYVYLYGEEITEIAGVEAQLNYDVSELTFKNWSISNTIASYEDLTIFPSSEPENGSIIISGALAGDGLSGTQEIIRLNFTYSGSGSSTSIDIVNNENTSLRNKSNDIIEITNRIPGIIELEAGE